MATNEHGDTIVYYITAHYEDGTTCYLAWQNPAWDESGYFWTTSLENFSHCLPNNTPEHPFVFDNEDDAIKFVNDWKIPFECEIVEWNIRDRKLPKENDGYNEFCYAGIAIELTL